MSQQIIINGHHLRHFSDILTLGIDPSSLQIHGKQPDTGKLLDKTDNHQKINHDCLTRSLTKKNGFFLNNFRHLGVVICLMPLGSNINNYQALRNQLILIHDDLLRKVISLHKQECRQIGVDPNHSNLKYLNLPSKRMMILKHSQKNCHCKVCLRAIELIICRLYVKYGSNLYLKTISALGHLELLPSISQQWILDKEKLILKSINLANIDCDKHNFDNYSSFQTYDELLYDMNIIGQLKRLRCPFHVSNNFSHLERLINVSDYVFLNLFELLQAVIVLLFVLLYYRLSHH